MRKQLAVVACWALLAAAPTPAVSAEPAVGDVMTTYGDIAEASYGDALTSARELGAKIDAMLAAPGAETLEAARAAWKAARVPYMQTEAFRFGNRIVDDWEGRVNAWPLDEGLIDYVDGATYGDMRDENPLYAANIVANPSLRIGPDKLDAATIDKSVISRLNSALGVEANVGTGYHAIEFLLWGQDLNGTGRGAGARPASDFDLALCTGGNCDRRRSYLKAATELLIDDLAEMVANWSKDGAARKALRQQAANAQLAAILTGIGSLSYGELAGERMKLGVLLHDPEEEQDCFSDNTHNSHYFDQIGMMNVWYGRYDGVTKVSGASLSALAAARAPEAARRLDDAMTAALARIKAIKDTADSGAMAYDQMLAPGNAEGAKLILGAVDALVAQARAVEGVVAALKLTIKIEGSDSLDNPTAVGAQ